MTHVEGAAYQRCLWPAAQSKPFNASGKRASVVCMLWILPRLGIVSLWRLPLGMELAMGSMVVVSVGRSVVPAGLWGCPAANCMVVRMEMVGLVVGGGLGLFLLLFGKWGQGRRDLHGTVGLGKTTQGLVCYGCPPGPSAGTSRSQHEAT